MTSRPADQLGEGERNHMAKFEVVALAELKTRLPAKLQPLVEEYRDKRAVRGLVPGDYERIDLVKEKDVAV